MRTSIQTRFPLLPYQVLAKRWRTPAFLLIPAGLGLWWMGREGHLSDISGTGLSLPSSPVALVISIVGGLLVIYTMLAKRANIECQSNRLVIHAPFDVVALSYERVLLTRPVDFRSVFPPQEERGTRLRFYRRLWAKTVPVVDLKGYPLPKWWLRLWLHPYLLHPRETALVVPVEEWMTFTRTLDSLRTQWREEKRRLA